MRLISRSRSQKSGSAHVCAPLGHSLSSACTYRQVQDEVKQLCSSSFHYCWFTVTTRTVIQMLLIALYTHACMQHGYETRQASNYLNGPLSVYLQFTRIVYIQSISPQRVLLLRRIRCTTSGLLSRRLSHSLCHAGACCAKTAKQI